MILFCWFYLNFKMFLCFISDFINLFFDLLTIDDLFTLLDMKLLIKIIETNIKV